ncbi:MAG: anti-CBASS Acb1 family protein [bacterium]
MARTKKSAAAPVAPVADGWSNIITGLGDALHDRRLSTTWVTTTDLPADTITGLLAGNWLAQRICSLIAEQSLRLRPEVDSALWTRFEALNRHELHPQGVLHQALVQGRAYGGALLIGGFRYGAPEEPLGPRTDLLWLDTAAWPDLTVVERETDANSPRYGLPSVVRVVGTHARRGLTVHMSRCILCTGLPRGRPDPKSILPWLSVLQPVYQVLQDYGLSWDSVGTLLSELSVGVLKMRGLPAQLSASNLQAFQNRLAAISMGRSVAKTLFLDLEEEFSRTEVTLQALPQLMQQVSLRMAGAAQMPATLLFGQEPAGLSATGESDMRQWYDRCGAYRENEVTPKLARLLEWIGGKPVDLSWPPLWQPTAIEAAQLRKAQAEGDEIWYRMGVMRPDEIAKSRARDRSLGVEIDPNAPREIEATDEPEAEEEDTPDNAEQPQE